MMDVNYLIKVKKDIGMADIPQKDGTSSMTETLAS